MWDCNYQGNPWNFLAVQVHLTLTSEGDQSPSLCTLYSVLKLTMLPLLFPLHTPHCMLEGVPYVTGEEWRAITNSCRKNEVAGPKQKQCSVVGVSGGESKVQCCKKQCCVGTWNIRSMNQDKLDVGKQEMARVNIKILEISELKWWEWVILI